MSEEIRTTAEIRSLITDGDFWDGSFFDSWLEQHDAEVVAKAEARIIKLLLEHPICVGEGFINCYNTDCDTDILWKTHFIALMKGEGE